MSTFLADEQIASLIAAVQTAAVTTVRDDDGDDRKVYVDTPESADAMSRLVVAFMPALKASHRYRRHLSHDDAVSVAQEAFVLAVREHNTASPVPFRSTILTIVRRAIGHAEAERSAVPVSRRVRARFWTLVDAHGGDVRAAYAAACTGDHDLSPTAFLSVLRHEQGIVSFDALDAGSGASWQPADPALSAEAEVALRSWVAYLFTHTTEAQEATLRLLFGFTDTATENRLAGTGMHLGEVMTTTAAATVLGVGQSTADRNKRAGLAAMHAAAVADVQ